MDQEQKAKNMEFWHENEETDPAHVKEVSKGAYKFHAIDAMYQVKKATGAWGPVGKAWQWHAEKEIIDTPAGPLFLVTLDLKTPLGDTPIQTWASCPLMRGDRIDADAPKKALTDALTKALSYTGMNADVFLGRFDDNRYVAEQRNGATPSKASEKQLRYLQVLLEQVHGDGWEDEATTQLRKGGLERSDQLTKIQATSWIEKLKAKVDLIAGGQTNGGEA